MNFERNNEQPISAVTVDEITKYANEGQFGENSMLPKVNASVEFVSANDNRKAVITNWEHAKAAIKEKTGTIIKK